MSGRFLLDTNIVIAIFAKDSGVTDHLAEAAEIFVPSIVLGELFYGARKSNQADANIARIEEFAADTVILACDAATGREYGRIKNDLANSYEALQAVIAPFTSGRSTPPPNSSGLHTSTGSVAAAWTA